MEYKYRSIVGIGLPDYGGLDIPQSAVCELVNQEN